MTAKRLLIVLIALAIAGAIAYQATTQTAATIPPQPLPPIDPPAGATLLEPGTSPHYVVGSLARGRPGLRQQAMDEAVGAYIPGIGWSGDVTRVDQNDGGTTMSLMVVNAAGTFGNVLLMVEAPGETRDIQPGDNATIRGRIKDIRLAGDPLVGAHQIYIEQARVTELTQKPR